MRCLLWILVACVSLSSTARSQPIQPRKAWTSSKVKGKPTAPAPYRIEPAFPELRFERPTSVTEIPGTSRLLITEQGGKLYSFAKSANVESASLLGDLSKIEQGGVGVNHAIPHPDFQDNRFLFVSMVHYRGGSHSRVMRYTLTDEADPKVVTGSGRLIIQWPAGGHGGGCLQFGNDGYLYISTGDGSGPSPPDGLTTGQDISDLLGAVLRIDVDRESGDEAYSIPRDNPFVDLDTARSEIWSYGLRNPWKFAIDPESGDIFVADNGWETWELIHKLHRGSNCGWPIMEGRARLRTEVKRGPTPITPPVKDHPHTEANSVIGGPVYRGEAMPDLNGTFVYGDYITGTIWGLKSDNYEHRTLVDTDLQIVALTEGSNGEIYVLDYDRTGQLYRLVPSDELDTSADFPRRLSDTGLFVSTESLEPADGVEPYSITAEPWMDGAHALRWIAVPGQTPVLLDSMHPTSSVFPDGTVLVKHLTIPTELQKNELRLETQILHYENGAWNPYSFLWDETGNDAVLVEPQGTDREFQTTQAAKSLRTWHVGAVNECRLCHNAAAGVVLGFTARQLDRNVSTQDGTQKQLSLFMGNRLLGQRPHVSETAAELVNPYDESAAIDDRARSYLHLNCGVCHHRQGPATISFYAHRDYPFDELRITKRPGIGAFGMERPQLVFPGDPYSSIILYRISKLGYGRMPYVGSRVVDSRGVELLESWIKSLPAKDRSTLSEPAKSDSEVANSLHAILTNANNESNAQQIDELLKTTEGALALVALMHRGDLSDENMEYVRAGNRRLSGNVRGLIAHFLPESDRRQTLGMNPNLETVLNLDGDTGRGELIFLSDNTRCKSCHDLRDPNKSLGPTLSEIRDKYKNRAEILRHTVSPSDKVDDKYRSWTVITTNGEAQAGMLIGKDDREVQLRAVDKSTARFPLQEIEVMTKSDRSLMPDGVLSDLTPQEAADLLAFLVNQTSN